MSKRRPRGAAPQAVTPALRQWIVEQAEAGFTPQSVLAAMRASGWGEATAIRALEETLEAHLAGRPGEGDAAAARSSTGRQDLSKQAPTEAAVATSAAMTAMAAGGETHPLPEPDLAGSPLHLDLGDRRVTVLQTLRLPRVVVFGDLLSEEECEGLIALARPRMSRSLTVVTRTGGGEAVSPERTSQGMFFERGEHPLVARIEQRLARLVRWPLDHGEGLQILQYRPGTEYRPHYDYFDPSEPGTPTLLKRGGQRVATLIMYLAEPEQGGATVFPDVGLEVAPRRGNAVFFSYPRPDPATRSLHAGAPVLAGEKWIATKWLRERPYA